MKTDRNTVAGLISFLFILRNSSVKAVNRNITQYPVCVNDEVIIKEKESFNLQKIAPPNLCFIFFLILRYSLLKDCLNISHTKGEQLLCFQYMCYPWRTEETSPFMHCRRGSDCRGLQTAEGEEWNCWRHSDRRNVHSGICLEKR